MNKIVRVTKETAIEMRQHILGAAAFFGWMLFGMYIVFILSGGTIYVTNMKGVRQHLDTAWQVAADQPQDWKGEGFMVAVGAPRE
jgi:hypothetical protein